MYCQAGARAELESNIDSRAGARATVSINSRFNI